MQTPYPLHSLSRLLVYLFGMTRLWRVGQCPNRSSILVDVVSAPTSSIISPPVALLRAFTLLWRDSLFEEYYLRRNPPRGKPFSLDFSLFPFSRSQLLHFFFDIMCLWRMDDVGKRIYNRRDNMGGHSTWFSDQRSFYDLDTCYDISADSPLSPLRLLVYPFSCNSSVAVGFMLRCSIRHGCCRIRFSSSFSSLGYNLSDMCSPIAG